jgi:hypothetical protein
MLRRVLCTGSGSLDTLWWFCSGFFALAYPLIYGKKGGRKEGERAPSFFAIGTETVYFEGIASCIIIYVTVTMKHGLSWQTASLLHLIGSEGKRIVKIANTK